MNQFRSGGGARAPKPDPAPRDDTGERHAEGVGNAGPDLVPLRIKSDQCIGEKEWKIRPSTKHQRDENEDATVRNGAWPR